MTHFKYIRNVGNWLKKTVKTNSVSVGPGLVSSTHRFFGTAHPPVGQKTSLVNFKHKITPSANYTDGIGTRYTSHDKEICLHGKRLKTTSKSINQTIPILTTDAVMKRIRGRGKKVVFFPPKTSYKIDTDEKRGEQVSSGSREIIWIRWIVIRIRITCNIANAPIFSN